MTAPLELGLLEPELDEEFPEDVEPLDEVDPLPVEVPPLVPEVEPLAVVDPVLVPELLVEPELLLPDELVPEVLLPEDVPPELPLVEPAEEDPPADLPGELEAVGVALAPEAELVPELVVPVPAEVPVGVPVVPPPVLPPEAGRAVNPLEVCAVAPTAKATPRTPRLATVTTLLVRFLTRQTPRREFGGPGFRHG